MAETYSEAPQACKPCSHGELNKLVLSYTCRTHFHYS